MPRRLSHPGDFVTPSLLVWVGDLAPAADLLGTNGRTIQRTLFSLGTSYRELLDRVRFEEATTLLRDSRHHITEIAYHLGYTEPANFTHAFRRWTGHSPATYRRQALQVAS